MMSQQTIGVSFYLGTLYWTDEWGRNFDLPCISFERYRMIAGCPGCKLELRACSSLCIPLGRYSLHGSEEASFTICSTLKQIGDKSLAPCTNISVRPKIVASSFVSFHFRVTLQHNIISLLSSVHEKCLSWRKQFCWKRA
jgi:hypothetical protein